VVTNTAPDDSPVDDPLEIVIGPCEDFRDASDKPRRDRELVEFSWLLIPVEMSTEPPFEPEPADIKTDPPSFRAVPIEKAISPDLSDDLPVVNTIDPDLVPEPDKRETSPLS